MNLIGTISYWPFILAVVVAFGFGYATSQYEHKKPFIVGCVAGISAVGIDLIQSGAMMGASIGTILDTVGRAAIFLAMASFVGSSISMLLLVYSGKKK